MKLPSLNSFLKNQKTLYLSVVVAIALIFGIIFVSHMSYKSYKVTHESYANDEEQKEAVIYFFFADWCPHCKKAKPEMEKIKNNFDNRSLNEYLTKVKYVDCTRETQEGKQLVNEYNVEGYPTIVMNINGEVVEFDNSTLNYSNVESFIIDVLK